MPSGEGKGPELPDHSQVRDLPEGRRPAALTSDVLARFTARSGNRIRVIDLDGPPRAPGGEEPGTLGTGPTERA